MTTLNEVFPEQEATFLVSKLVFDLKRVRSRNAPREQTRKPRYQMLDQRQVAAQPDEKREQLFTERYDSLLKHALRLTGQRESAEDLVQDAFVQFMLGRTRLEEIENIDGYLRRMLRYMHISRMSRSAQYLHDAALSVADYDSCRLGWTAIEPPRRMQAFEELHQICTYACLRKESSRAGSVLILRFFHDYFPSEIARILNTSRHCVDQWQRLARREAKLFINEPGRLRFVNTKTSEQHQIRYLRSDGDLMLELRQMIFNSRRGEHLSLQELQNVYLKANASALTAKKLAHIVSCPTCLDVVNRLLDLPLLAQRYHAELSQPEEPPRGASGGGASGAGSGVLAKKLEHRLRETHEHKPHELRIAVNGFLVSSLKVSSNLSELNLNLTPDDPIEFVEVFSEQGVQLLFFSINPTGPQREQWAWIELSESRSLKACFQNENGPSLHVVYEDPAPGNALITGETPYTNALSSPLYVVPSTPKVATQRAALHFRSWMRRLFGNLKRMASRRSVVDETSGKIQESPLFTLPGSLQASGKHSWLNLNLLVGLVSAVIVVTASLLFLKVKPTTTITPTALLERATAAEQFEHNIPDRVRHRFIRFEERRIAEGTMIAERKIEIWENLAAGTRSERLYDASNKLIAGAWQKADGSRTVYQHGSTPTSQPALASPHNLLLTPEDLWQLELSPQTFNALIAEPAIAKLEERSTTYVLSYEGPRTIGASRLLKVTLTLSKSDLHPIEQTLLVQRGGELREYRFVEASLELLPVKAVAPAVFEIEPELTGGAGELGRPGDWALRDLTSSRVPPSPSTSNLVVASAELEIDVTYLLNQVKADRNEQVALSRSAGGSLRVEGFVESQQRKEEFLRALAPVSNNPAVKIDIRTIAEALDRPPTGRLPTGRSVSVQEAEETPDTVAVDAELRAYFMQNSPAGLIDEAVRSYSSRMVNRAYRSLFHAIELKRLVNRFANVDMQMVAPDARGKWLGMLRQNAAAFARENAALQQEIQPVFFPGSSLPTTEDVLIESDADLARAVERLHKLALANNDAVRSAFTISSKSSATAIKSAAFWQSLQRAERLAETIRQYQAPSN
jgi:RNA polymerase sigma factor (sigma-70 family)